MSDIPDTKELHEEGSEVKHVLIPVGKIHPNPHRNFKRNPICQDQVAKLVNSIKLTGFWDNIVVRPHPELKGEYQLAYGHNRLAAVKKVGIAEVRIPVTSITDHQMYELMVKENATQRSITSAIVNENIRAGVELICHGFKTVGAKGTEEDFNRVIGRSVPRGTDLPSKHDGGFEKALAAYHRNEGIGKDFVSEFLGEDSGTGRDEVVVVILNSIFGESRQQAKNGQADAKDAEAKAKEAAAKAAKDAQEKTRLEAEAKAAKEEAARLRKEAKKVGEGVVSEDLLIAFDEPSRMAAFVAAVKRNSIPKKHHKAAKDFAVSQQLTVRKMEVELGVWWYERSGQGERDRKRLAHEEAFARFRSHVKRGDLASFLHKVVGDARSLHADVKTALTAAKYLEDQALRDKYRQHFLELRQSLDELIRDLTGQFEALPQTTAQANGVLIPNQ